MKYLSERVSMERGKDRTSVVISARLPKAKEALLVTWALAWLVCGILITYQTVQLPKGDMRQYLLVFLAFWLYFMLRIGRSALWRTKGFELIRIKGGVLTVKDSIWGMGKARDHFVENIKELGLLTVDKRSWKWQLNESFWVIGGERLGFAYMGRKVLFGKGLDDNEARQVLDIVSKAVKEQVRA